MPKRMLFPVRWLISGQGIAWLASLVATTLMSFLLWWFALFYPAWPLDSTFEQLYSKIGAHSSMGGLNSSIKLIYLAKGDTIQITDDNCRPSLGCPNRLGAQVDFAEAPKRFLWRNVHAGLIRNLADAGASIVAFDIIFDKRAGQCQAAVDNKLADTIRVAGVKTRVILGVEDVDVRTRKPEGLSDSLCSAIGSYWGLLKIGDVSGKTQLRHVLLAEALAPNSISADATLGANPSLALRVKLAFMEHEAAASTWVSMDLKRRQLILHTANGGEEKIACDIRIAPAENSSPRRFEAFIPVHLPSEAALNNASADYQQAYCSASRKYDKKIVIVGAGVEKEDQYCVSPGEVTVYGYQVHAAVLSDLLNGTFPHHPGPVFQVLGLFIFCILGSAIRLWRRTSQAIEVPKLKEWIGRIPVALLMLAGGYLLAAGLFYNFAHLSLESSYYFLAGTLGYFWSGGVLLKRRDAAPSWDTP
jgi:CHASE2 domain-containing sensor protein